MDDSHNSKVVYNISLLVNPLPPVNKNPPNFPPNSLVKQLKYIAGMIDSYILPTALDPDNDTVSYAVTLPNSKTKFIQFQDNTLTFTP